MPFGLPRRDAASAASPAVLLPAPEGTVEWPVLPYPVAGKGSRRFFRLLAIRFESLVELDDALRNRPVERWRKEDLLRHSLMNKPGNALESKAFVVAWIPHKTASFGVQLGQARQAILNQRLADSLALVFGQDRHGTKPVPVSTKHSCRTSQRTAGPG